MISDGGHVYKSISCNPYVLIFMNVTTCRGFPDSPSLFQVYDRQDMEGVKYKMCEMPLAPHTLNVEGASSSRRLSLPGNLEDPLDLRTPQRHSSDPGS